MLCALHTDHEDLRAQRIRHGARHPARRRCSPASVLRPFAGHHHQEAPARVGDGGVDVLCVWCVVFCLEGDRGVMCMIVVCTIVVCCVY